MIKNAINIIKSKSDKRNYYYRQLPNHLKCLLIQDKDADKSSAAMNVNVGSLMDTGNFYGLAHFLEHMLFMGTEKYPSENDFMEFLNENSGHSNAYTDLDSTNYFFEVSNEAFIPAVDRFAQFFIKPLFNESAVEREVKAVDSENKKNLQVDMWRFMQLIRSQGNPHSLFTRFATGNLETLNKPGIRDVLIDYHKRYYSSNLMNLVMLSPKPIEEMNSLTEELFSKVPINSEIGKVFLENRYSQNYPYDENNTGYFYKIIPVKDQDTLSLYWFFNVNLNKFYDVKPMGYLSSLFGHEGPNSLTSSLVKDDLITHLSCGHHTIANTFTNFTIDVKLTKKGFDNYSDVIRRIFLYINKIKEKGVNKRFFDEIRQVHKIKFDFKNKEHPTDYCSDLAHNFTVFPPEDVLSGPYLINSFDEKLIDDYLKKLEINNMNIYLSSKSFQENECDMTELWYKTKFSKTHFTDYNNGKIINLFRNGIDATTKIKHTLDYPPENKFLPSNLELLPIEENPEKYPKTISETQNSILWYKKDNTFKLPKASVILQIYLNKKILSNENYDLIASIWNSIFDNELKEIIYMASEANINLKLHFNMEGLYLEVSGFNSSLENAFVEILSNFKKLIHNKSKIENLPDKIKIQIEDHMKSFKNFYFSAVYTQAMAYLEMFLREPSSTPEKKLKILTDFYKGEEDNGKISESKDETNSIGAEVNPLFDIFLSKFLQESRFEWLIQGNITAEDSIKIKNQCENILSNLNLNEDDTAIYRIARIPPNKNFYYVLPSVDLKNENSAIVSFFQVGNPSESEKVSLYVIESLMREKFFDELRTKQTLGYIVRLAHREYRKVDGFVCVVQSSIKSPEDIHQRITKFMSDFKEYFKSLTDDHFENHRISVITELKQKDLKLVEEVHRNFIEIKKRDYEFDRRNKQIELLLGLKKENVEKMFNDIFIENPRRLDIEILAENHKIENEQFEKLNNSYFEKNGVTRIRVYSLNEFKKSVELYPDFFASYKPKF
jgi:insulysin